MDDDGEVIGEARQYDPYSQFGHIMLYEIDSFGFVPGFIKGKLKFMSEEDLKTDPKMRVQFEESQYQLWKRQNVGELLRRYNLIKEESDFEKFCKKMYRTKPKTQSE